MSVETTAEERVNEHGRRISDRFRGRMQWKYDQGQKDHGGDLSRKPVAGELMSEVVDLAVYAETHFDQLGQAVDLLSRGIKEHDWISVIQARNVLTHGNPEGDKEQERNPGCTWEWSL